MVVISINIKMPSPHVAFAAGALAAVSTTALALYALDIFFPKKSPKKSPMPPSSPPPPPPPPQHDVTGCVGNTPMVRIHPSRLGFPRVHAEIYAKLEFQNPGGSVKDRIAVAMIDKAELDGSITPGVTTLVEATSGNTGIAVAMVGAARGYKVVVAMPRLQAMLERYILIRSFGGRVILSEPEDKSQGFLDLAEKYAEEHSNCYLLRQFTNEANPTAHYETTGPEIFAQMNGNVDAVVMGAGTGGTAVGVGKYLKEKMKEKIASSGTMTGGCRVCVVEPTESRVMQGSVHRVHSIVGIGTGLCVPMLESLDPGAPCVLGRGRGIVDEFLSTDTPDSLDMALLLASTHGLLVGPSTGAAVHAALELGARPEMQGKRIVVVAPSSGVRYLQHPMFKMLRSEAFGALSESLSSPFVTSSSSTTQSILLPTSATTSSSAATEEAAATKRLELVERVEGCILGLVRKLLATPTISSTDNLIDCGATSLTAMLMLGKLRDSLAGLLEGSELHGLKLAIIKERLWGSTHDLAHGVVGVDEMGGVLPYSSFLIATVVIEYCGG